MGPNDWMLVYQVSAMCLAKGRRFVPAFLQTTRLLPDFFRIGKDLFDPAQLRLG